MSNQVRAHGNGNMVSYIRELGHQSFDERPFCEVDSLILSQLSYLNYRKCDTCTTPCSGALSDIFSKCFGGSYVRHTWNPDGNIALMRCAALSRRFGDVVAAQHVSVVDRAEEEQFSAITFHLNDTLHYIAYRGTDATVVGWKEDFNLSFSKNIPSQYSALRYAEQIARTSKGTLILGGHSKGGNLAVYAAMNLPKEVRARIFRVYNHDGPGFPAEVFDSPAYRSIQSLIHKTIPQTAIIGLMLEQHESYFVVASNAFTLFQHDPFSWIVQDGSFVYIKDVDNFSKYTNRTLNAWLSELDIDTRKTFVDSLYAILRHTDAVTLYDLASNWRRNLKTIYEAVRDTDPSVRRVISQTIGALIRASAEEMKDLVHDQVLMFREKMQNEE